MTLIRFNGVFDAVEEQFSASLSGMPSMFEVRAGGETCWLSPDEARRLVRDSAFGAPLASAVWRRAIEQAQRPAQDEDGTAWTLFVVWLCLPGLRHLAHRVLSRFPVDRAEVEAEALAAVLEEIAVVDPAGDCVGDRLARQAHTRVWNSVRPTAREVPVADVAGTAAVRELSATDGEAPLTAEAAERDRWELHLTPLARSGGVSAGLRFTTCRRQIEGERLGALAKRLGLQDIVLSARRLGGAREVGALRLLPGGGGR
ncbi:hypothetical protein [Streptomyces sp. PU-14G]|uniref:hypothetical protein n=1 Tax=Streptomyces sp. PU-14G TaxID=2800808 RepID=UPI0034DE7C1F